MDEMALYLLVFTVAGLLAGAVLGVIGNRLVFRLALALGCLGAVWLGISAALDHGWGQIGKMIYAALTLWAAMVGTGIYSAIRALHHVANARTKERKA